MTTEPWVTALDVSKHLGVAKIPQLRQKQYDYYRDLLLSFPEPGTPKPNAKVAA